jgi:hypothetical protein
MNRELNFSSIYTEENLNKNKLLISINHNFGIKSVNVNQP